MSQIKCLQCKNKFEFEDIQQEIINIKCPLCKSKMQITKNLTNIKLPQKYKTYIDQNRDLIIEKKLLTLEQLFELIRTIALTIFIIIIIIAILSTTPILTIDPTSDIITKNFKLFLKCVIAFHIVMAIFYMICNSINILFNSEKISVGNNGIEVSLYPIKLPLSIAKKIPSQEIEQIYCEPLVDFIGTKEGWYSLIVINNVGKKIVINSFEKVEEAHSLEILIEKRLSIENKKLEKETTWYRI